MSTMTSSPALKSCEPSSTSQAAATSRIRRNMLSNAGGICVHVVLQLALMFLMFDVLSTAAYAAYISATAVIAICEMASDFGARLWATREFAITSRPRQILKLSWYCKLFYTVVSGIILAFVPLNTLSTAEFLLAVLVAASQPATDPFLWYLRGRERLDVEAVIVLTCRVVSAALMAVAAWYGQELTTLLSIWLGANLVRLMATTQIAAVSQIYTDATVDPSEQDSTGASFGRQIIRTITDVFPVGSALFLRSLYQRIGVLLLSVLATDQDVRIFGTAFRLVATAGFLSTSMFVASFAPLVRAIESNDQPRIRGIIRGELKLVTLVFVPICLTGILVSIPFASAWLSPEMVTIARAMVLLLPGLYLSCINMGLKYAVNAFGMNWPDVAAVLFGILMLSSITVFHGPLTWSTAASLGWGMGEGAVIIIRLGLLRASGKQTGVPVALIASAVSLLLLASAWSVS